MDASAFAPIERDTELTFPGTKKGTGVVLVLASGYDQRVMVKMRKIMDDATARRADGEEVDQEDVANRLAAAHIVGIKYKEDSDKVMGSWAGGQPDVTDELALDIASRPWFRGQIQAQAAKMKDFFSA